MQNKIIFKEEYSYLNSDFSFSESGCGTKAKKPNLSCYLHIIGLVSMEGIYTCIIQNLTKGFH